MNILNEVSQRISSAMRPFNDDLIYGFRKRKIASIPEYLDSAFRQTVTFFNNQLQYIGYRTLTPEERLEYLIENSIHKGQVSIRRTETSTVRFEFSFQGDPYYIYVEIPYLQNECVVYNDTEYYPLFPIVERGSVNVTDSGTIIVKVMRVPITFGRRSTDKVQLEAISGNHYWGILVTVKIYMGQVSKKGERIPLVLYPLCRKGFRGTMKWYNIPEDSISVVHEGLVDDKANEYFMLPNGLYLRANKKLMENDIFFKRMVLSLFKIYLENTVFTPADVIGDDTEYYCTTLGRYICSKNRNVPMNALVLKNAWTHLDMTDLMLDGVAQKKLVSVGINVKDTYDLLHHMFFNIDTLIVSYNPINLYDKMIGSLDQLMGGVIRGITTQQYGIINSKRGASLTPEVVKTFCRKASQRPSWISMTSIFRPEPSVYGDNLLLTVAGKRFLSLDSVESQYGYGRKKKRTTTRIPPHLLKSHPSHIAVTSILDIPASTPVATGSINPYLQIDDEGNIIENKEHSKILEHVFD